MTQIHLATPVEPTKESAVSRFLSREVAARYLWAVTRLCLGWTFLWPFMDKLFGLGHETTAAHAWINGGSPARASLVVLPGPLPVSTKPSQVRAG